MKPVPSVLASPWAVEPHWLRVVYAVWSRGTLDAAALAQARAEWKARAPERRADAGLTPVEGTGGTLAIADNVAVITVDGPLFRHANMFSDYSGGTTYDSLWRALKAAEENRLTDRILLNINSPGGEADGLNEIAKAFASTQKPLEAYVDGMCASAALWLASGASKITAEESAEIGSIGVRCGIVDYSGNDEMHGIREIEIISSQSPGKRSKPVDDDVIGRLQTRIDDLADLFVAAVARGRGVSAETVLSDFGQGDVMIASKALEAGLIDSVGTFSTALAAFSAASISPRRSARARGVTMAKEANTPVAGDGSEWQCAGCNEMMGASAKSYCAKCAEDDDAGDDDEEEAKALGLDPKASRAERMERAASLRDFRTDVLKATGCDTTKAATAKVVEGMAASTEVTKLRADGRRRDLRVALERGISGAPGKLPTLAVGELAGLSFFMRGEARKNWAAAHAKMTDQADKDGRTLTVSDQLDALCAIDITGEDLESVVEAISKKAPIAASAHAEPERDGEKESDEVNSTFARIDKAAAVARALLDKHKPAAVK